MLFSLKNVEKKGKLKKMEDKQIHWHAIAWAYNILFADCTHHS